MPDREASIFSKQDGPGKPHVPPKSGEPHVPPKPFTVPEGYVPPTLGEQWRYVSLPSACDIATWACVLYLLSAGRLHWWHLVPQPVDKNVDPRPYFLCNPALSLFYLLQGQEDVKSRSTVHTYSSSCCYSRLHTIRHLLLGVQAQAQPEGSPLCRPTSDTRITAMAFPQQ